MSRRSAGDRKNGSPLRPFEPVTLRVFSGDDSVGMATRIPLAAVLLVPLLILSMGVATLLLLGNLRGGENPEEVEEQVRASVVNLEELRDELQRFATTVDEIAVVLEELEASEGARPEDSAELQRYLSGESSDLEALLGPGGAGEMPQLRANIDQLRESRELLVGVTKRAGIIDRVKDEIPNRWPVVAGRGRVTLEFGPAIHPITGSWYLHKGFDVADFTGTPILAMAQGTVTKAEFDPYGYGNQVVIEHKYGFETSYAHMNRVDVREGQWVQAGQRIGTIGMTGIATGTHVHIELSLGGQIIDPAPFIRLSTDFTPYNGR